MTATPTAEFEYVLCDRTDVGPVSIWTVTQYEHTLARTTQRTWTVVSTCDGQDFVVSPNGNHLEVHDGRTTSARANMILTWITENV